MTKREMLELLEPFTDEMELWMECDAGIARVDGANYDPKGPNNDSILVLYPEVA